MANDGLSWSGADFEDLLEKLELMVVGLPEQAANVLDDLAENGEAMVRQTVELSGRIDSGELLRSVGKTEVKKDENELSVKFGFVNDTAATGSGPREGYAYPQEFGFHHKDGSWVEGMFALRDAALDIEVTAPQVANVYLRRLFSWRGL